MADIPEEYLSYDFGFSAVDDPYEAKEQSQETVTAAVSEDVERKLDSIEEKIQALTSLMFRMEEDGNERVSEADSHIKPPPSPPFLPGTDLPFLSISASPLVPPEPSMLA